MKRVYLEPLESFGVNKLVAALLDLNRTLVEKFDLPLIEARNTRVVNASVRGCIFCC